ncbi:myosin heavy chain, muscle-like [Plakobranchus ocellatus]|uniref:Myosin heavy chain, muscle-like n=1 Tax=Plakobranchus ocellatus TaxID=259542 RepID=A0AAV3YLJ6_9GAST|nr:myosin heavy chain, muscle-like [Plakobranchus ocellatus]
MEDLSLATLINEREKSAVAERISLYNSCLPVLDHAHESLQALITKKHELKLQYLAACEEKLILNELLKPSHEWMSEKDAEKEMSQEELEMNAVFNERKDAIIETVVAAADIIEKWKSAVDTLSQKIEDLKAKKSELDVAIPNLSLHSLSLHHMEVKTNLGKVNVLLEAAKAERTILTERIARMEDSLQHLSESQAQLERKYSQQKNLLHSLKQTFEDMQKLSGVECWIIDESRVRITLQAKNLMDATDRSQYDHEELEDCTFTADLKFIVNSQGFLEVSDVQTEQKVEEVVKLISHVKQDKDLPKFILSLRNTWLSHLPLNAEVSCLRKNHAIDFIQDQGVLQLMINKRNIVCSLTVPSSYPHADVTLASVIGHPELTADNISAPATKSITGWVRYLEDLLGKHQE